MYICNFYDCNIYYQSLCIPAMMLNGPSWLIKFCFTLRLLYIKNFIDCFFSSPSIIIGYSFTSLRIGSSRGLSSFLSSLSFFSRRSCSHGLRVRFASAVLHAESFFLLYVAQYSSWLQLTQPFSFQSFSVAKDARKVLTIIILNVLNLSVIVLLCDLWFYSVLSYQLFS